MTRGSAQRCARRNGPKQVDYELLEILEMRVVPRPVALAACRDPYEGKLSRWISSAAAKVTAEHVQKRIHPDSMGAHAAPVDPRLGLAAIATMLAYTGSVA